MGRSRIRVITAMVLIAAVSIAWAPTATGAPTPGKIGGLDTTFGTNGVTELPLSHGATSAAGRIAIDATGRIYVLTFHETPKGVQRIELTAYRPDGHIDPRFNHGRPIPVFMDTFSDPECCSLTAPYPTSDGGVTVGFGLVAGLTVRHYSGAGGLRWSTNLRGLLFGSAMLSDGSFRALTTDFWAHLGTPGPLALQGLTPAGKADPRVETRASAILSTLATPGVLVVDHADRLLVMGSRYTDLVTPSGLSVHAARLSGDGSPDRSWGDEGLLDIAAGDWGIPSSNERSVALAADGSILFAAANRRDLRIRRMLPDGTFDGQFGRGGLLTIDSGARVTQSGPILIDEAGRLVVGTFSVPSSSDWSDIEPIIARFDATTGAIDHSFGDDGTLAVAGVPRDLALTDDGRLVALSSVWEVHVSATLNLARRALDAPLEIGGAHRFRDGLRFAW